MLDRKLSIDLAAAAAHNIEESKYWTQKFSGELVRSNFPYDFNKASLTVSTDEMRKVPIKLSPQLAERVLKIVNKSDYRLHMILAASIILLLERYTGNDDIIIGSPVYKQKTEGKLINTLLALRNYIYPNSSFKDLLIQVKETITEAVKNQNYPIESILYKLDIPWPEKGNDFPLFDVALILENIHDKNYLRSIDINIIFSFLREGEKIKGAVLYNPKLYKQSSIKRIVSHLINLLYKGCFEIEAPLDSIEIFSHQEKQQLVIDFNKTTIPYPFEKTIDQLFEEQVELNPDNIAVTDSPRQGFLKQITYRQLDEKADCLSHMLRGKGVIDNSVIGITTDRSMEMIIGIMGILKSRGAYLPIDPEYPVNRIHYMLKNCNASFLLTNTNIIKNHSFTQLQSLRSCKAKYMLTNSRQPIRNLDTLPFPDRSLIDYEKYAQNISLAMVKHCISLQGTRGCPYNCAYCAKLWPKKHVARSAEHIFAEVKQYYDMGVRRFSFIDDIFNLDIKNSSRFFQKIIDNKMEIQLLFPAGLRGDIMTEDYIDLMVKAGTVNISLALETASPRLQKLIGKNLNIPKLKKNLEYICKKHPEVIIDLFTMHGLPTETEEEAQLTMEFIKSLKWLHFPLINILKIYPGTDMEKLAIESGITKEAILKSENLSWHEFSETLPFDKNFTVKYQADFLNDYFLLKERLLKVLPYQMKVLTENEIVQKYNSYLPVEINNFDDLLQFLGISKEELKERECVDESRFQVDGLNEKIKAQAPIKNPDPSALKILLLDLSQSFSADNRLLDELFEPPLGLMYLLSWLNRHLGDKIDGRIAKSGIDFDTFHELNKLLNEFKPDVIGIRTLTFYKDFFHQTVSIIRQWRNDIPIITGGPYATNSYATLLQDRNVDIVVMAEGELTFAEIIERIAENNGELPGNDVLSRIPGIAFLSSNQKKGNDIHSRQLILMDWIESQKIQKFKRNSSPAGNPNDPAYVIYTSGSTGKPKGVMIEHHNVNNLVTALYERVYKSYSHQMKVGVMAPFVFDASVKQIFAALLKGHCLCLIPEEARLDGVKLLEYYKRENLDISDGTPAYIQLLAESMEGEKYGDIGIRHFLIGGEQISTPIIEKFFKNCDSIIPTITNVYGPTECSVDAASFEITSDNIHFFRKKNIPIGKPLANINIYILSKNRSLQPLGVVGEIFIGGAGVGRGYINRPELTADKFVNQSHLTGSAKRLYKSGDLARRLEDGNIEFNGRVDYQVKIRGYRIELEEIKNQLSTFPGIKDSAVIANGLGVKEDIYICAYIVAEQEINKPLLKKHLSDQLPEYMIPWKIFPMENIPLTSNGKVDKKALPLPTKNDGGEYTPPENKTHEKLVEIWSEILGLEKSKIGIDMDFFDLGGHSLKAVILVSRIHREMDVRISLVDIFSAPMIRKIAQYIDNAVKDKFEPVKPIEKKEYYQLSSAQKRLFILQQMESKSIFYNKPYIMSLEGTLDMKKLRRAFNRLIMRHESFRTSYRFINGEPAQLIHPTVKFTVKYHDLERNHNKKETTIKTFLRPFDLAVAPLIRIEVIKESKNRHILMVDIHHITSDGLSMEVVVREFMTLLDGKNLLPLKLHYKDYAEWERRESNRKLLKEQKKYWKKELGGKTPILKLPIDFPRPNIQSFEGNRISFRIGKEETLKLNQMAQKAGATLYALMLGIYYILLSTISGQEDIIIGTPVVGRRNADLQYMVGMFVNTLALRVHVKGNNPFHTFLLELRDQVLDAFDNQDYQFEQLLDELKIERDMSRNPLFDVMFALQKFDIPQLEIPGLVLKPYGYENKTAKFDLNLMGTESEDGLALTFEYCSKLFKKATIEDFIVYFKRIISNILIDPSQKICRLEILSAKEKEQILYHFNDTKTEYPREKTIHCLFEEHAVQTPDRIALTEETIQLTYRGLAEQTGRLAGILIKKGSTTDSIIAIMIKRSIKLTVGILAILKAGGAYLPVDPDYPQKRIDFILNDSNAQLLLKTDKSENKNSCLLSKMDNNQFTIIECPPINVSGNALTYSKIYKTHNLQTVTNPEKLAYIMYTSGSTGQPKGVMVSHRNVVRLVKKTNFIDLSERTRILETGALVFDATTFEIWGSLLNGGRLYLVNNRVILEAKKLEQILINNQINTLWLTSPLFNQLMNQNINIFASLEHLLVGGDILSPKNINKVRHCYKNLKVINGYGPTENTTFSVCHRIDRDYEDNIPIGKPIANSTAYIVNRYNRLQPMGIPGELVVGGDGISRGYLNNPELTFEKFCLWQIGDSFYKNRLLPFNKNFFLTQSTNQPITHSPIYKTGDLAKWLPEGIIEFLGRIDNQVKIRGFRIEPGEIESRLGLHKDIKEVYITTLTDKDRNNDKSLCAYITGRRELNSTELRDYLTDDLPTYMIPNYFVQLEALPLTPNGKVDQNALPKPELKNENTYTPPETEIEKKLVELWAEVLGRDSLQASQLQNSIGIYDNFFELGGHSLNATILMSKIHKELEAKVELRDIFQTPTIREIAQLIQGKQNEAFQAITPVEKKEYYSLSSAQKRLYFLQQLDLNSTGYNMPMTLPLGQKMKVDHLESVLKQLISRHESLRTSFVKINDEVVQRIHTAGTIEFSLDRYQAEKIESEEIIQQYIKPFDLSQAPLIRSGIIEHPGDQSSWTWIVDVHHIVSDGTSHNILIDDFIKIYRTGLPLKPLPIQYKDFTQWQNRLFTSGLIKKQENYWLQLYAGEIPRLDLATDFKRPDVFTFEGEHYRFRLEKENAEKFKVLGARYGGTLYMNILAVLNTLFYKYTGQTDIIIGSGIAGRQHNDIQSVVGMFVNTLAMRNYPTGEKVYENFLKEVTTNSVEAFDNQDVQFDDLVDRLQQQREASRNPLFDITMVVQNFKGVTEDEVTIITPQKDQNALSPTYKNKTSKFDMTFFVHESTDHINIDIEYYTGIFKEETINRLATHFKNIIQTIISNPSIQLKDIGLISEEEKRMVLQEFNKTTVEIPKDQTIHGLFEDQVKQIPNRIALVYQDKAISFHQLEQKANQLAYYLHLEKRLQPETMVGVLIDRSLEQIIAILGILKAGGAYLPLDDSLPETRIKNIIEDAQLKLIISAGRFIRILNKLQWECKSFNTFLCLDSSAVYLEKEAEKSGLMDESLWDYVANSATDEITGGGWFNSYTGEAFTSQEMAEYGDNILKKLTPLLHNQMKILEIGCGSGISMYRIAPKVRTYYATDLSNGIIEYNRKKILQEGYTNIFLSRLAAHEIRQLNQDNFDMIIINSVIQSFHGLNYLRSVIVTAIDMLADKGTLFIGDILDQDLKENIIAEMLQFKYNDERGSNKTKTDWSEDLFVSKSFLEDLKVDIPEIESIEFSYKIHTITNELTRFRYDALITVNKSNYERRIDKPKQRHQEDINALRNFPTKKLPINIKPDNPAYIIYTSGSTGKPKGVVVEHHNVIRLVNNSNYIRHINFSIKDRFLLTGAFAFDISTFEIWGMLLNGLGILMMDKNTLLDMEMLKIIIDKGSISIIHFTPQLFIEIADHNPDIFKTIRCLLVGGDVVTPATVNRIRNRYRHLEILHMYGPTENTTFTTFFPIEKDFEHHIPIGKPISNSTIYILNPYGGLQPIGIPGELYTGGEGVARGYLNSPELTAKKFVSPQIYSDRKGINQKLPRYQLFMPQLTSSPLYRSGDLAKWLSDGNIEFLGRVDYQVKIRGYRVELGEIENRLLKLRGIKETVVMIREESNSGKYICAYIVSTKDYNISEIREFLSQELPDYMLPSYFISIEKIPLTPNGKVDRRALPKPGVKSDKNYIAPVTGIEKKLVALWSEILSRDEEHKSQLHESIGINDNFFEIGGHSLRATVLVSNIHKELNVKVPLAQIFKTPTIRELAQFIKEAKQEKFRPLEAVELKEYYTLSSAQKRYYILQQMKSNDLSYNMPRVVELKGKLNLKKLSEIFNQLTRRHDSLRTSFENIGTQTVQKVHSPDNIEFQIEIHDKEADLNNIIHNFIRIFDLTRPPLFRVGLIRLDTERHILMLDMHHIISDGISFSIFIKDFMALYRGETLGPLKLQYKDFAHWQQNLINSGQMKKQEDYWLERFKGEIPGLNLPVDYPGKTVESSEGDTIFSHMKPSLTNAVNQLLIQTGTTLNMVLLAVYNILLSRYTGQEDIIVGSLTTGRNHVDLQNIIGLFLNSLALRNFPNAHKTFAGFLNEIKENTINDYANQDYQYDNLVEQLNIAREGGRSGLFDTLFTCQNLEPPEIKIPGLTLKPYGYKHETAKFDLYFDAIVRDDTFDIVMKYSTARYKKSTIEKIMKHFIEILEQVTENHEIKLEEINISTDLVSIANNSFLEEDEDFGLE